MSDAFTPEQMADEQAAWDFYIERRKAMADDYEEHEVQDPKA
jgi:hypothetical protein